MHEAVLDRFERLGQIAGKRLGVGLVPQLHIHLGSSLVASIVSATIGALLLLLILRLIYRRGRW